MNFLIACENSSMNKEQNTLSILNIKSNKLYKDGLVARNRK